MLLTYPAALCTAPRGLEARDYLFSVSSAIVVRGARQHNLKNLTLEIPHRAITVVTGPSGSGKSSLAFDTVFAEGQRRYVESLSAYARQFLDRMQKPDVDSIEGIAPAVAIEQKNPTRTSRSTVGTATEVYDYLRLLFARVGRTSCPLCGRALAPDTPQSVSDDVGKLPAGTRIVVAFPLRLSKRVTHAVVIDNLRAQGFLRISLDGGRTNVHLDEIRADVTKVPELLVVVDRVTSDPDHHARVSEAVATAFREGDGDTVLAIQGDAGTKLARYTDRFECPDDGTRLPEPTPQLFSFNNPRGACSRCNGFGAVLEYDESLIVPDTSRTLREGAIDPWTKPRYDGRRRTLADFARREKIPFDVAWSELSERDRQRLLHARGRAFTGIVPFLTGLEAKKYKQYIRVFLRQYQTAQTCPVCLGSRLHVDALNVRVAGRTIAEVSRCPLGELRDWMDALALSGADRTIAQHVLREAHDRVRFLCDVGLGYLTLDRATRTLSGGEAQRIALANSLGSRLIDTLYVLDEPSIGLHSRDMDRLLSLLVRLRDAGNTVLIVEHDLDAIRIADRMIELGPGSGERGGQVVYAGPLAGSETTTVTGQYLSGARTIPLPQRRRAPRRWLELKGVREHNLHDVDVRFPLGALVAVTGVSGSGKSTLVHDVLYRALETALTGKTSAKQHLGERIGTYRSMTGHEGLASVVLVDQEPIGRSPRSNPVTYIKAYDEVRRIFAETPLARQRRYTAGTFSFNVKGGRCETCEGAGYLQIEMVFMADVYVPCEACGARRFKPEVLDVKVRGRSIHDVLQLSVDEAIRFFPTEDTLGQDLWQLQQVGLGYLRLGQPATTLSGGEAQRVKIARELTRAAKDATRKLYIMDEPTTGLHVEDVRTLVDVLQRLVDAGNTVVVIEHNLDVIKLADWLIDLGPDAGDDGGRIVAMGTPEDVAGVLASHTGAWLRKVGIVPRASGGGAPGSRAPSAGQTPVAAGG
ncbi:MAG: UvrABC system protein A [Gemmatimonadaceae bacterium]|nr:UvrABC system protein A [Gemmatimonadaceae bacterium]